MYRVAVVEDQINESDTLVLYLKKYADETDLKINIRTFRDGDEFLDETGPFDVIFLDIEMKRLDGLNTARKIRETDEHAVIVFVTKLANMALEGYSVEAADFIVKPVFYNGFAMRMSRIVRHLDLKKEHFITIKSGSTSSFINIMDIDYIEAKDRKVFVTLHSHKVIISTDPLYTFEEKLADHGFFPPHMAFLVNLSYVHSININTITVNGMQIPVSKHRRKEFMKALVEYRGACL